MSPKSPALQVESFNILHNVSFFPPTGVDPKNTLQYNSYLHIPPSQDLFPGKLHLRQLVPGMA